MRIELRSSTGTRLSAIRLDGTDPARSALLVHGLASNALTWGGVAEILNSRGWTVVSVDQRSHGESEVTEDGYDFATYAADLAAVIAATGLDAPVVAGQSWGGNVVVEFAHRHPERCRAVVGVDGGAIELQKAFPKWSVAEAQLAPPVFNGITIDEMRHYMRTNRPTWPEDGIEATLANFRVAADGTVSARLPRDKHMLVLRSLYDHDPRPLVDELNVPAGLLVARSGPAPDDIGTWFPNTRYVDGDHDLHVQQPQLVADFITEASTWQ